MNLEQPAANSHTGAFTTCHWGSQESNAQEKLPDPKGRSPKHPHRTPVHARARPPAHPPSTRPQIQNGWNWAEMGGDLKSYGFIQGRQTALSPSTGLFGDPVTKSPRRTPSNSWKSAATKIPSPKPINFFAASFPAPGTFPSTPFPKAPDAFPAPSFVFPAKAGTRVEGAAPDTLGAVLKPASTIHRYTETTRPSGNPEG